MEDICDGVSQWRDGNVLDPLVFKGDASVQAELKGCYRNRSVFERISKEMSIRGHYVHSVQLL